MRRWFRPSKSPPVVTYVSTQEDKGEPLTNLVVLWHISSWPVRKAAITGTSHKNPGGGIDFRKLVAKAEPGWAWQGQEGLCSRHSSPHWCVWSQSDDSFIVTDVLPSCSQSSDHFWSLARRLITHQTTSKELTCTFLAVAVLPKWHFLQRMPKTIIRMITFAYTVCSLDQACAGIWWTSPHSKFFRVNCLSLAA